MTPLWKATPERIKALERAVSGAFTSQMEAHQTRDTLAAMVTEAKVCITIPDERLWSIRRTGEAEHAEILLMAAWILREHEHRRTYDGP